MAKTLLTKANLDFLFGDASDMQGCSPPINIEHNRNLITRIRKELNGVLRAHRRSLRKPTTGRKA